MINAALATQRNILNAAAAVNSTVITIATGAAASVSSGFYASPLIPVIPGSTYTIAAAANGMSSQYGIAFYDANGIYVSAGPGAPYAAGMTFTVPAAACQIRVSLTAANLLTQMITLGTVAPTGFVTFAPGESTASSALGDKVGFWGDSITAQWGQYWQPTILARLGIYNASRTHAAAEISRMPLNTMAAPRQAPTPARISMAARIRARQVILLRRT